MPEIKFTDITNQVPDIFYPVPGKAAIPAWMNNLEPYIGGQFIIDENGYGNSTAKRCLPMFDAVACGYILKLTHDIKVEIEDGVPSYQWPKGGIGIDFHSAAQASTHEAGRRGHAIPKLLSPWSIKTPPGYSTLFVPPLNNEKSPIEPFSGMVDTDKYFSPVNFPFSLTRNFEGTIKAGTPIIQAIPVFRESWKIKIDHGSNQSIERNNSSIVSMFRNGYRKMYWNKKDYS